MIRFILHINIRLQFCEVSSNILFHNRKYMSNNPFVRDIDTHFTSIEQANPSLDVLRVTCQKFEPTSCPCVGKSILPGKEVRLVSDHVAYPDQHGAPCIKEISGEQLSSTPEYKECLLASTCQYFFPEMKEKFSPLCANPRECNVPLYTGYGSEKKNIQLPQRW